MNRTKLYENLKNERVSWDELSDIFKMEKEDIDQILPFTFKTKTKHFGKDLKIYLPGKKFPSISITGSECKLNCEHCNKKYIKSMQSFVSETKLEEFLISLWNNGGIGALISGGCEEDGSVPIAPYLDTILKIKQKTKLIINAHPGLLNALTAQMLAKSKIDIISFDITTDQDIMKEIYHLDVGIEEYESAIKKMQENNLNIVPHLCIGLYYGKLHKELDSIKFIKSHFSNPKIIVAIALIPPKESKKKFSIPETLDIIKILVILRLTFPHTEIALGCMRPKNKNKEELEKLAIKAGINRIVLPSRKTIKWIKNDQFDINLKYFSACCALPQEYEILAKSNDEDIVGYSKI